MDRVAADVASIPVGSARTVSGALIPAECPPKPGERDAMNLFADGHPAVLDGISVDRDPSARVVSVEQRGFLT